MLFVFCIVYYHPVKYPTGADFPVWANAFGWFLSSCSMIVIPGYAVYYMLFTNKHLTMKEVRNTENCDPFISIVLSSSASARDLTWMDPLNHQLRRTWSTMPKSSSSSNLHHNKPIFNYFEINFSTEQQARAVS